MARDLKLTIDHDIEIENNDLSYIEDGAEVAQSWRVRMLWLYGEYYYNKALGMPWFNTMFRQSATPNQKRQVILDMTLATPGVVAIRSFEEIVDDRSGSLALRIATEYNSLEELRV
jgi:hypothetical protein